MKYSMQPHNHKYILYRIKVRIEDYTMDKNPNIRVTNTYMVKGHADRVHLIERIKQFAEIYNLDNWNRSDRSMMIEIYLHNVVYHTLRPIRWVSAIKPFYERSKDTNLRKNDDELFLFNSLHDAIKKIKYIIKNR